MSSLNPERAARRLGKPTDALRLFEHGFRLTARCRRPGCIHTRELAIGLLLRLYGAEATLEQVGSRLRCSACGTRGARIETKYVGRRGDGR